MRRIEVEEGLRLRFAGRCEEFQEGVEIGLLAGLMAAGAPAASRRIGARAVAQARSLAEAMGYRLIAGASEGELTEIHLRRGRGRPALRLVAAGPASPPETPLRLAAPRPRLERVGAP